MRVSYGNIDSRAGDYGCSSKRQCGRCRMKYDELKHDGKDNLEWLRYTTAKEIWCERHTEV